MKRSDGVMTRVTCDWPGCREEFRSASLKSRVPLQLAEAQWRVESQTKVIGPTGTPIGKDPKVKAHVCKAHVTTLRMERSL